MAPALASSSLQLCVFDSRRGQQEGHELDKILFFYPLDCPLTSQLSLVGLSEGLITFSRIFSSAYPCDLMEADKHIHIFHECEPDIWIIMVVEKESDAEQLIRNNAYRNLLKEMFGIFKLFHGSISAQLQKNPAADIVRNCLYSFVPDYIGDIISAKTVWLPTISDSLTEQGTVKILSLDSDLLLDSQSLLGSLESSGGTSLHSLVLFHNYLLTSTLSPIDTTALYSYAVLRMIPTAVSQSFAQGSKKSYSRHSVLNSVVSTFVSESKRITSSSSATVSLQERSVCQPLQQDAWWQDSDGFLATSAWGGDAAGCAIVPSVWIQETGQKLHLCAYQHRALTLLMLVPSSSLVCDGAAVLKKQILDKGADMIQQLEEKLTKQWGGNNSLHVPGYRYLHHDLSRKAVKASPPNKVATLAKESLAVLNRVRGEVDAQKGRDERSSATAAAKDSELCLRAKNNAWISVRARSGQELYIVLEKASDTLLLASDVIDKFSRRHCEGRFSSD